MMEPSKEPVRVSEHAICQYLSRVMGLDIEMVRAHILGICAGPAAFGAVCVRSEGFRFEIANGAVTTVTPDHQLPSQTSRDRAQHKLARSV